MTFRRPQPRPGLMLATITAMVVLALGACGSDGDVEPELGAVSFGDADDRCESAVLTNDLDDEKKLRRAVDCLFAEIDAGNPVTVDIDQPTVEGDSIFLRYAYDGESFLLVQDSRLDAFGSGSVDAQRCVGLLDTGRLPEGRECEPIDHGGFVGAAG